MRAGTRNTTFGDLAGRGGAGDISLPAWRHAATNALMTVSCLVYLPAVALFLTGHGPVVAWPVKAALAAACMAIVCGALLRRSDYRPRMWALLFSGYVLALLGGIAVPQGFFLRALPLALPILAMVLLGAGTGRVAALVSAGIILLVPFLTRPGNLFGVLMNLPPETAPPPGLIWTQVTSLVAMMVAVTALLDRFHLLLTHAHAGLRLEAAERAAASRRLEQEMAERQRLERQVAGVAEAERRRLGLDIHDGVCQQITGALVRCEALARRLDRREPLAKEDLAALSALLEEAIDEAHAVAKGLCPLESDPDALAAALGTLARRTTGVTCRFKASGDVRALDPMVAQHLYRIAQEAAGNAARHARAGTIRMSLTGDAQGLRLEIADDGDGLPENASTAGMGLRTMAYRARLLESELEVTSVPGGGTRIACRVPRTAVAASREGCHSGGGSCHGH